MPRRDVVSFPACAIKLHPVSIWWQDVLCRKSWAEGDAGGPISGANALL